MVPQADTTYTDVKGRRRWRSNDRIAVNLKELHDLLVIGGYDELHARRYPQLAYAISRHPESIVHMHSDGRVTQIPGVSKTIARIIGEYIETGTCTKMEQWSRQTPRTVLELTKIDRLGAKTARILYQDHDIDSLASLVEAIESNTLDGVRGIGVRMKEIIRAHVQGRANKRGGC